MNKDKRNKTVSEIKILRKYYNKDIPDEINVIYGVRYSGRRYKEIKRLKARIEELEENKKLNNIIKADERNYSNLVKEWKKQNDILNKAIEFINDDEFYCKNQDEQKEFNYTLLDILKGK